MEKLSSDTWARVKVETVLTVSLCKFFALCLIVKTIKQSAKNLQSAMVCYYRVR